MRRCKSQASIEDSRLGKRKDTQANAEVKEEEEKKRIEWNQSKKSTHKRIG